VRLMTPCENIDTNICLQYLAENPGTFRVRGISSGYATTQTLAKWLAWRGFEAIANSACTLGANR
jgi:hypothetical protein